MGYKTKERILDEALVSFANNGYKGTNLRDLATNLGLSKSALYRHFNSKEDIWNAVFDHMESYYAERFGSPRNVAQFPKSGEELLSMSMQKIQFTLHDPKVILTRRLLLTEQFHDKRTRDTATLHFLTGTKEIFARIFAQMMQDGVMKKDDPELLAFSYTAPITELIHLCDRQPEKEPEIMAQIERFIRHFIATYVCESKKESD